jgi:predicted ribosome quality control (RQC) complex YloA/Tae2 family protein
MELSSLDLYFLVKELQIIKNAKIDKVFDDENKILFQIHIPGKGKKYLKIILPSLLFLTDHKGSLDSGNFGINIRKHLKNTRIRKIEQVGFERILKLTLDELVLFIELFSPGNIILCKNNKIIMAKTYKGFGARMIRPNAEYEYPVKKHNFLDLKEKDLADLFEKSKKSSVVITLATELGLGGMYAEHLLKESKIDKTKTSLDNKELKRLYENIEKIKNLEPKGYFGEKITPIEIDIKNKIFDSFNDVIDLMFTEKSEKEIVEKIESKFEKKKQKIFGIIKEQELRIEGLKKSIEENQKKAEFIYENYQKTENILDEFNKARKKYSMKEIKEKIKGSKIIKSIDEEKKRVVVEL